MNTKHKIKVFIWKCLNNAFPVKELIHRRTRNGDPICKGCEKDVETVEHVMMECNRVKEIWRMAPMQ